MPDNLYNQKLNNKCVKISTEHDTSNTWEFQMYMESLHTYLPIFKSEKNFSCLNSPNKADEIFAQSSDIGVIKAKCLENPFKCFGIQEESGEIDQFHDGTNIIPFNATTKAPCVFPFKYGSKTYNSCSTEVPTSSHFDHQS